MKPTMSDIVARERERGLARLASKVPEWAGVEGLEYPSSLALEQCSSSPTALYKASLLRGESAVADLTGGLGVDSWAFSLSAARVLYNEMNPALASAVEHNFALLGISNVVFSHVEIGPDTLGEVAGFAPGLIYLDPSRRDGAGRKVFLPEQCSPDILGLRDALLEIAPCVLVKLSPMADIPMLASRLGEVLSELHVVGLDGECKELLCLLERGHSGPYILRVISLPAGQTMDLDPAAESSAEVTFPPSAQALEGTVLFEPSPQLSKSGCFRQISQRWSLWKLGRSTQLYAGEVPGELEPFGKRFIIKEIHPLRSSTLRGIGRSLGRAEVSARNIPMSSEQLRSRLGVASGGDVHVFGVTVELSGGPAGGERYLLVCERL